MASQRQWMWSITCIDGLVQEPVANGFDVLSTDDLPALGGVAVTSVQLTLSGSDPIYIEGSNAIVGDVQMTLTPQGQTANTVFAGPTSGGSDKPTFRVLVAADMPATVVRSGVPLTTTGDMIYSSDGSGTAARLAIGAATTVLHGGTIPSYSAVVEGDITLANNTTNNVSSTKHGFAPISPADAGQFLNGAATPAFAAVTDANLSTSNITTNNVSTSKHGFTPILPNDATKYLDGTGAYSVPTGSGGGIGNHYVNVYNSGNISITAASLTALTFDSERDDTDAYHSTSSGTSKLTVPTGGHGVYIITGVIRWAAQNGGDRITQIRLNGTTIIASVEVCETLGTLPFGATSDDEVHQVVSRQYKLSDADYVELMVKQTSAVSLNIVASGNYSPEFGMILLAT